MAEEVVPEQEPVLRPKEDHSQPIKHLSWDMFGRQIIALFASGVVKSYSWKYVSLISSISLISVDFQFYGVLLDISFLASTSYQTLSFCMIAFYLIHFLAHCQVSFYLFLSPGFSREGSGQLVN